MPTNKLITLAQLKSSLEASKEYIDAQDAVLAGQIADVIADVEGLVATGGEANILEGLSVNGVALPITNKLIDMIVESGTENGTINVAGIQVAVAGLKKLAFQDEIGEDELSAALKTSIASKATQADLSALEIRVTNAEGEITTVKGRADALEAAVEALENAGYQTAAQVEVIAKAAVAASGHAHFEKVDAVPSASEAEDNVMYLVMNTETGHYDIYAKVGESVELLDDTTVDLSAYSTTEQMTAAIAAAVADKAAMADLEAAVERITAVEAKFTNYFTKEEAEAKFLDEAEGQAIAENAASAAVEAAKADDSAVESAVNEVFGSEA